MRGWRWVDKLNQRLERRLESSLDELLKDPEALAVRNHTIAEAMHRTPFRHRLRRVMLQSLATAYVPLSRRGLRSNRILLIRPDHLGDLILTLPAIRALRASNPYAEIHMLVGNGSAGVLQTVEEVDAVLTLQFPGFTRGKPTDWRSPYQFAFQTARRLRRIGYAQAIIFRPDHWWGAWLARLTGIPRRVGYDHQDVSPFLTQAVRYEKGHVVQQNLRLVEALTGQAAPPENYPLSLPVDEVERAYVSGYLQEWGLEEDQRLFCIHPGAGTSVKQWEPEKWVEVATILSEQLHAVPVFTGSDHELPTIRQMVEGMSVKAVVMAGDTAVGHLAALYQRAQVVLGPDSGPMHLAVAVDTPTVTLYGPADPDEFGSWGNARRHAILVSDIACRPCRILDWSHDDPRYHPCVRAISVTQVLTAARNVAAYR